MFLFIHQLIYEKVACIYPEQTGMVGKSQQQIRAVVNADLRALSTAKFGIDRLSNNDLSNNKVCPSIRWSLM
jgi:hypothetical protein